MIVKPRGHGQLSRTGAIQTYLASCLSLLPTFWRCACLSHVSSWVDRSQRARQPLALTLVFARTLQPYAMNFDRTCAIIDRKLSGVRM